MLDKSIPWHSFIMSLTPERLTDQEVALPAGYRIRLYAGEKDELAWARIETAVGEFASVEEAIRCHRHYLAHPEEVRKRQWFVVDENDDAAATCTVWWHGETRIPCIHALSCLPEKQGLGLGKAVALHAIRSALQTDRRTIWLETQTWSWKAVCLYMRLGFAARKTAVFNDTPNEFAAAFPLICAKVGEAAADQLWCSAID